MSRSEFEAEPDEAEGWTFIDRSTESVVEQLPESEVQSLVALAKDLDRRYEIIHPDGSREVSR